eukprot:Awhi_evm1s7555
MILSLSQAVLFAFFIGILNISASPIADRRDTDKIANKKESWLLVQNFRGGSIQSPSGNDDSTFLLTLNNVGDTIGFTDKPYRVARTYDPELFTEVYANAIPKGRKHFNKLNA